MYVYQRLAKACVLYGRSLYCLEVRKARFRMAEVQGGRGVPASLCTVQCAVCIHFVSHITPSAFNLAGHYGALSTSHNHSTQWFLFYIIGRSAAAKSVFLHFLFCMIFVNSKLKLKWPFTILEKLEGALMVTSFHQ